MTMRRRTAGLSVLLTITLGFVAVGARATPAGAPSTSTLGTATPMLRTSNAAGWVGPPFLPRIRDYQFAHGIVFDPVEQAVARQKLTFKMPAITAMTYTGICLLGPGFEIQFGRYGPVPKCPSAQEFFDDAAAKIPPEARPAGILGIVAEAWFQSPPGSQRPFGLLPPVRVNSVAFGSIPVTANVHISQPLRDGMVQPFSLRWLASAAPVPAGVVIPGYGPAPGEPMELQFELPPIFGGPVEIRLSDVEVDGVPVPVGNDCAAAADVNFHPRGGYYNTTLPPQKGEPGEFSPLAPLEGFLPGTVDIEPFSNCHHGAEDLAPLLTNMISGPGNHIDMTQKSTLTVWCDTPYANYPYQVGNVYCDLPQAPPEGQTMTAQRAKSAASSAQSLPASFLDKLPATVRKQLAGFMKQMTPPPTSAAKR